MTLFRRRTYAPPPTLRAGPNTTVGRRASRDLVGARCGWLRAAVCYPRETCLNATAFEGFK